MALPHYDDGEHLLPPEVAIDEPPLDEDELEAWLAQQLPDTQVGSMPPTVAAFADSEFDPERAEWAMGKLIEAQRKIKQADAQHAAYTERLDRWHKRSVATPNAAVKYFEGVLAEMLRKVHFKDPTVKSIKLPSGTLVSRGPTKGNEYEAVFTDKERFIAWARAHRPDLIEATYKAKITDVRKGIMATSQGLVATTTDGEVVAHVPGVMVRRKEREFKAEPGA